MMRRPIWLDEIFKTLAFFGISVTVLFSVIIAFNQWLDAQVAQRVAQRIDLIEKQTADASEEVKELRALNIQIAQLIVANQKQKK